MARRQDRDVVRDLIDWFLADLENPTSEDVRCGWTPRNRALVRHTVEGMKRRLDDPRPIAESEKRPSLARDVDDLGIVGGPLLDRLSELGNVYSEAEL